MWVYKNKQINTLEDIQNLELVHPVQGFVYQVTHLPTGKKYVGKKFLEHTYKAPPLKGEKRKRTIIKESDWKTYCGSNKIIKQIIKDGATLDDFNREILEFCFSKKHLTYSEVSWQFKLNVLGDENYLNENILGKFYPRDLIPSD